MDVQTQDARHTFGTTLGVDRMQTAQGFVVRLTNTGVAVGRIYRYTSAEPWTVRVGVVEAETTGSLDAALAAFEDRINGAAERRMGA